MTDNVDCIYYVYEKDTGQGYCKNDKADEIGVDCNECKFRYSIADAKADAKHGHENRY